MLDFRVPFWAPFKWVARLRDRISNPEDVLLLVDQRTGHAGEGGRYAGLQYIAFELAFLLSTVNVHKSQLK